LLNVLTNSRVGAADRAFETLDTTSRRLRFPHDQEVIVTDTVGFIRDLPKDLLGAFRTTLEELRDADLLLHLVDVGAKDLEAHIIAVDRILEELGFDRIPKILVFNKCDHLPRTEVDLLCRRYDATGISALRRETLHPLIDQLERHLASLPPTSTTCPQPTPVALASQP
jgi:GTP-binding protein HflX